MNTPQYTTYAPSVTVSPNVPAKTLYWQGYDMYCECAISGDYLNEGEYASLTPDERRGYDSAACHAADAKTAVYLANYNAYGDRTNWGF